MARYAACGIGIQPPVVMRPKKEAYNRIDKVNPPTSEKRETLTPNNLAPDKWRIRRPVDGAHREGQW